MKKVLITSIDKDKGSGGNKAKDDIKYFLNKKLNFKNFDMAIDGASKAYKYYFVNTKLRSFIKEEKPDVLFFQYPNITFYVMNKMVSIYRKYVPNGKIYFIIHDIMGWQFAHREEILNLELDLFNRTDGLVVHNESMEKFLREKGINVQMSQLGVFDYRNEKPFAKTINDKTICFPGNLGKSKFLQKMKTKLTVNLYGPNQASKYPEKLHYCGNFPSDKIPGILKESFGLIWDGESINTCSGSLGEYLRINDPHKASLYISTGIPVVTWNNAALAHLIEKYGIGITVRSLSELDSKIVNITDKEYQSMKEKTENLGEKVKAGYFIVNAFSNLLSNS